MLIKHTFLFFIFLLIPGVVNATIIEPGAVITIGNADINTSKAIYIDSVNVGSNNVIIAPAHGYSNTIQVSPTGTANIELNYWGLYTQKMRVTSAQPTDFSITGYQPGTRILVNGANVPNNGSVAFTMPGNGDYRTMSDISSTYRISHPELLVFPVGANITDSAHWYINNEENTADVVRTDSESILIRVFEPGMHHVRAVSNAGGMNITYYFTVLQLRQMATAENATKRVDRFNASQLLEDVIDLRPEPVLSKIPEPWTILIGKMAYAIIFGLPFLFMWINTRRMTMPTIMFLLVGWMIIGFIPAQFHYIIWIGIAATVGVVFFKFAYSGD